MNFSPEQQAAIDAQNRELLVSAAAGSGKTAVLIEKIYTMLKSEGLSVDRMLVVTSAGLGVVGLGLGGSSFALTGSF